MKIVPKKIRKKLISLAASIRSQSSGSLSESTCPTCKDLYESLQREARSLLVDEPLLTPLLHNTVLHPKSTTIERLVARTIATRLIQSCGSNPMLCVDELTKTFVDALESDEMEMEHTMLEAVQMDMNACVKRDPACESTLEVLLFYKGFASLVCHRVARRNWLKNITNSVIPIDSTDVTVMAGNNNMKRTRYVSLWLQSQASAAFGIDIHPAATIGAAVMFDHGTGIVIGETATVGDYCTFLHGVTLGGTGKETGDRHPKVGKGVLIGANASILGNIKVGDGAKIGAGSVVLKPIPSGTTAVGAPAKIIGFAQEDRPGMSVDSSLKNILPIGVTEDEVDGVKSTTSKRTESTSSMDDSVANENDSSVLKRNEPEEKDIKQLNSTVGGDQNEVRTGLSLSNKLGSESGSSISDSSSVTEDRTTRDLARRARSKSTIALIKSPQAFPQIGLMNCPFRQFRCKGLPSGAVSYECLSTMLSPLCSEAEIGEIYVALLKFNPNKVYIPSSVMEKEFSPIAQKFSSLDEEKCDKILKILKTRWRRGSV